MDCQSRYFECCDYDNELDSEDANNDDSDTDSCSSDEETAEHIVTNCYLIHTEQMCECCNSYSVEQENQNIIEESTVIPSSYPQIYGGFNKLNYEHFLS